MKVTELALSGINKVVFTTKKYSPEILVATSIVTGVAATVMACKATLKVDEVLAVTKSDLDRIHETAESEDPEVRELYSESTAKRDIAVTYIRTGAEILKLYGPSLALGALSVTSVLGAYNIMRKRNVALAAAYVTIDKAFKEYRKRVIDKYGQDADNELRFGTGKTVKIEDVVVNEDGTTTKTKKKVPVYELDKVSDYAIDFRDSSYYSGSDDHDDYLIRAQERYVNDLLRIKGSMTLNDILDALDVRVNDDDERMKRIRKAGMVVGWKLEKDPDKQVGDNCIIFNVIDTCEEGPDGNYTMYKIIDFNVDGNIYDRM